MNIALLLNRINGCTFAGLDTLTPVKLTGGKANPQKDSIFKANIGSSIMLGASYQAMINRRLEAEYIDPSFIVSPLSWGERIGNSPLIQHNGEVYLQTIFIHSGDVNYFHNQVEILQESIIGFPTRPQAPSQGGLQNKVIVRTYNIRHITSLRMLGEVHTQLAHPRQQCSIAKVLTSSPL